MKKSIKIFSLIVVVVLAATACQQTPLLPVSSDTPSVEQPAASVVITADNAIMLTEVYSASVNSGAVIATWTADGSAIWLEDGFSTTLYDSATGSMIAQFDPGEYIAIYDVSPDGKTVAYSPDGIEIHLYDVINKTDILTITPSFPYTSVFFNANGSLLGAASLDEIKIFLWDTTSGEVKGSLSGFETAAPVYSATFGADGKTLVWFSRGTVQPMEIASQKMGPTLSHEDFVIAEEISPNGKVIATTAAGTVGGEFQPLLMFWNADSGEILRQIAMPEYTSSIAFSPDSELLAAAAQNTVLLFSVLHGDEIYQLENSEVVVSTAFSPDGTKLIVCGDSGTINMYMVEK